MTEEKEGNWFTRRAKKEAKNNVMSISKCRGQIAVAATIELSYISLLEPVRPLTLSFFLWFLSLTLHALFSTLFS